MKLCCFIFDLNSTGEISDVRVCPDFLRPLVAINGMAATDGVSWSPSGGWVQEDTRVLFTVRKKC